MATPSRMDNMIKNSMKRNKNKNPILNSCQRQFPDCPAVPSREVQECKLCPFNKKLS